MIKTEILEKLKKKIEEIELEEFKKEDILKAAETSENTELWSRISNNDFEYFEAHLHTEKSLLDGVNPIKDYVEEARKLGHKTIAITDHRVTHGWFPFREAIRKNNEANKNDFEIKPIYGCEIEVWDDRLGGNKIDKSVEHTYHMVLWAKNMTGYRNILKIVSWGHLNGKRKQSISIDIIKKYSEGIRASSACLGGILAKIFTPKFFI